MLAGSILATSALGWALHVGGRLVPEGGIPDRPIQIAADGYASSEACRACHPSEYAAWRGSFHRTMTGVATPESVAGNFDAARVDAVDGRAMFLERRGRALWADFDEPDWDGKGGAPPRIRRQVVMTTGSHHQQIYWYATGHGRALGQLPAVRLIQEGRWIPRRSATMHPPETPLVSESGSWNGICVQCHTTQGKPGFDTPFGSHPLRDQAIDTTAVEFGIACESCHGPGGGHAQANASPRRRYWYHLTGRADPTIVQPERLTSKAGSQVCGQCHGLWEFYDREGERFANSNGLPYRPGDDLARTRFVVQPTRNMDSPTMKALLDDDPGFVSGVFWSDGMVRATGREYNGLIESPCYRNAKDDEHTLSCLSCHAMHKAPDDPRPLAEWADDQLTVGARGNGACLPCHEAYRVPTAHTRHRADSTGSSCYNCHMPHTTYGLLKTIRSHQISSPSVQASLDTGRPNACNLCHLDKTLQWTAENLRQWYGAPVPALGSDDRTIAASLVWLLKGDAGQRAIVAQAMGWVPAQQASGTSWLAPYLALMLTDPYDAVRFITYRSLRGLPGFEAFTFDFVAPLGQREARRRSALDLWRRTREREERRTDPELLLKPDGTFRAESLDRLMAERNNRRVFYRE